MRHWLMVDPTLVVGGFNTHAVVLKKFSLKNTYFYVSFYTRDIVIGI